MTESEKNRVIAAFFTWLDYRQKYRDPKHFQHLPVEQLKLDAEHSSLLRRLLHGKEVLPVPPPVSFSYPWYELVEDGKGHPFEVTYFSEEAMAGMRNRLSCAAHLLIDQTYWRVKEVVGPEEWLVQYYRYPVNHAPELNNALDERVWRVRRAGEDTSVTPARKRWEIVKE